MSVTFGTYDGEATRDYADSMSLSRITDEELRLARALEMFKMKEAGVPVRRIARKYRLCVGYVYQEIRSIPDWQKERVRGFALAVG
jgi:Mor family transcriptional regulator